MTTYTNTVTVKAEAATEPGALDGYRIKCNCGFTAKDPSERLAHCTRLAHLAWHHERDHAANAEAFYAGVAEANARDRARYGSPLISGDLSDL